MSTRKFLLVMLICVHNVYAYHNYQQQSGTETNQVLTVISQARASLFLLSVSIAWIVVEIATAFIVAISI